jgi:hypothetical protein
MVSKNVHEAHKTQKMDSALNFLKQLHKGGNEFLDDIVKVRDDENWISFVNVQTKKQLKQWRHTHSPNKP